MKKILVVILTASTLLVGCGSINEEKKSELTDELISYVETPSDEIESKVKDAGYELNFATEYYRIDGKKGMDIAEYQESNLDEVTGLVLYSVSAYGGSMCAFSVDNETDSDESTYVLYNACIGSYTYVSVSLFDENDDYVADFVLEYNEGELFTNTETEVDIDFYIKNASDALDGAFKELNKILK